jgi:hypothetical protein
VFGGAISAASKSRDAAADLLKFLKGSSALRVIREQGMGQSKVPSMSAFGPAECPLSGVRADMDVKTSALADIPEER